VVIENRAGAGGAIGATAVAQSPADGYTLMVSSSSFATTSITQRVPWGVLENFTPVALLARSPFIVLVHPDFPARSVPDLVRMARERPGAIDYGSSGPGGINHFVTEYFCLRAGIQMNHVPYRGMPPAVTDLVAGHIPVLITTMPSAAGEVREGRVRLLAYTAPGAPDGSPPGPTVKETGIDYESDIWWGLFGPRGLPPEILARATFDAADYMGLGGELGSIEPGKKADFFLVPGNPVEDLKAIKTIRLVSKGGTVYFPSEIYPHFGIKPFADVPVVAAPTGE
jgi:tripartite-type tricarboxylate transporter receptor subunit TctC